MNECSSALSGGDHAYQPGDCQIELQSRMASSMNATKKLMLRNFFSFYLKTVLQDNEKLNLSYLSKLKD